jgi:hypothetical protein
MKAKLMGVLAVDLRYRAEKQFFDMGRQPGEHFELAN